MIELQQEFAHLFHAIEKLKATHQKSRTELDAIGIPSNIPAAAQDFLTEPELIEFAVLIVIPVATWQEKFAERPLLMLCSRYKVLQK